MRLRNLLVIKQLRNRDTRGHGTFRVKKPVAGLGVPVNSSPEKV